MRLFLRDCLHVSYLFNAKPALETGCCVIQRGGGATRRSNVRFKLSRLVQTWL